MRRSRDLELRFHCTEDWSSFTGDDRTRHCERCCKQVHDLSALTRTEARTLFDNRQADSLCVRYHSDGQGRVLFRSERYPGHLAWKRFVVP